MRNADQPLIDVLNEALQKLLDRHVIQNILGKYGIEYQPPFTS